MKTYLLRFTVGFVVLGGTLALLGFAGFRQKRSRMRRAGGERAVVEHSGEDLYEAEVADLFYAGGEEAVVVLKAAGHKKPYLVMTIGVHEARAIHMGVQRTTAARPLTHDLLMHVTHALGAKVTKMVVEKMQGNTYLATLYLMTKDGKETAVDTRPSDGIAAALKARAPIYLTRTVLDSSGYADLEEAAESKADGPDMVEQTLREL